MKTIDDMFAVLDRARELKASDVHFTVGMQTRFRVHGDLQLCDIDLTPQDVEELIMSMLDDGQKELLAQGEDLDFALNEANGSRSRVNIFRSRGCLSAVLRLLNSKIPSLKDLVLPPVLSTLVAKPRGLILVTGPTGSGKSTTLASMINEVNLTEPLHILTIEDPIEYVYDEGVATVRQREIGVDVKDINTAIKSALREDPDIILVGEMRDYETISLALTAAETGHLVLGTLHTTSAAQTIDRIIDACPPHAQEQVRTMLASTLQGVITQCLVKRADGNGRIAATEILIGTDAVTSLIRGNKCHQIVTAMQSGRQYGMHTLNANLAQLVKMKVITKESAFEYCTDPEELNRYL